MSNNSGGSGFGCLVAICVAFVLVFSMAIASCSSGSKSSSSSKSSSNYSQMNEHQKEVAKQSHEYKEALDSLKKNSKKS